MKEKYYRHEDILNSKVGCGPSQIWRNIWGFNVLIKEGMRWRVGKGNKIRISGDKWLPTALTHKIQSLVKKLQQDNCVNKLINHNGYWNLI